MADTEKALEIAAEILADREWLCVGTYTSLRDCMGMSDKTCKQCWIDALMEMAKEREDVHQ